MEFLSEQLVSSDYRTRLQQDLRSAQVCRFLVAYISREGINAIGRNELRNALQNEHSFGVGSLTCACGWTPLVERYNPILWTRCVVERGGVLGEKGDYHVPFFSKDTPPCRKLTQRRFGCQGRRIR